MENINVGNVSLGTVTRTRADWYTWESCWQLKGTAKSREDACHALLKIYSVIQGAALMRNKRTDPAVKMAIDKWDLHYQRLALRSAYKLDGAANEHYQQHLADLQEQAERAKAQATKDERRNQLVKSISPHQVAAVIAAKAIKRTLRVPVPVRKKKTA